MPRATIKRLETMLHLNQQLIESSEVQDVARYVLEAFQTMFPDVTIAYLVNSLDENTHSYRIELATPETIGKAYKDAIKHYMISALEKLPNIVSGRMEKQPNLLKDADVHIISGTYSGNKRAVPLSQLTIPIIIPRALGGVFYLSSAEENRFEDPLELEAMYEIVSAAGSTIARIHDRIQHESWKLSTLINNIDAGVATFSHDQLLLTCNNKFKAILHLSPGDSFEELHNDFITDTTVDLKAIMDETLAEGTGRRLRNVFYKDKYYDITIAAIYESESDISFGVFVMTDVSYYVEIEQMKREFISVVSHQLRTPLTSIRIYSEMLLMEKKGELNKEQKKYADQLHGSVVNMVRLINDVLNVSRFEGGRISMNPTNVELVPYLEEMTERFLASRGAEVIQFKTTVKENETVHIDPELFKEALKNLLTNALNYSDAHKNPVQLKLEKKKQCYQIQVIDKGIGIPQDAQQHLFEKFYRAPNAHSKSADGSGLGLYLTNMIIKESGATISFSSEEGKGTTFTVQIPR